jgi:TP901 family phage tail tape measure protein
MPVSSTGRPAAVLSILVTANARPAQGTLAALDRQMAYSVKRTGAGAMAMQRSLVGLKFAAVGLAAGTAGAVGAAIKFESAFASVRKTVNATEPQFRRIREDILDLSQHIPESASSLAELAGEAGALGIKAKDLVAFTKTAAQLGTTTQMTSEAAADGLARLANIMDKEGAKSFRRMGSVLVDLGNKGASTEGEISAMSLRIAGAGKQVGLTVAEVQGMAAALANLGIRAEMGGSAISRVMNAMQAAIAEGPSAELSLFAETAGMSVEKFRESFEKDVPGTIAAFADGMNRIKEEGGSAQTVLVDLGKAAHTSLGEIRIGDTLRRIAGNTDEFTRAQQIANKEWEQNNALTVEAQKRYDTLAAQADMLKNSLVRVGIDVGTKMLPQIKEMVEVLRDPDLTLGEKAEAMFDGLFELVRDHGDEIAEIGGKIGLGLAQGLFNAFWDANPLGKLLIASSVIRMIGGPGALGRVGGTIGTTLGQNIGTSTAAAMGRTLSRGLGFAAVGIGIGESIRQASEEPVEDAAFRLTGTLGGAMVGFLAGGPWGAAIGTIIGDQAGAGIKDALDKFGNDITNVESLFDVKSIQQALRAPGIEGELRMIVARARESGEAITRSMVRAWVTAGDISLEEAGRIINSIQSVNSAAGKVERAFAAQHGIGIADAMAEDRLLLSTEIAGALDQLDALPKKTRGIAIESMTSMARWLESTGKLPEGSAKRLIEAIEKRFGKTKGIGKRSGEELYENFIPWLDDLRRDGTRKADRFQGTLGTLFDLIPDHADKSGHDMKDLWGDWLEDTRHVGEVKSTAFRDTVAGNFDSLASAVVDSLSIIGSETNTLMSSLDAEGSVYVANKKKRRKSQTVPSQRGSTIVPGTAAGDRHLLSLNGVPIARVESGEKIAVVNRQAAKAEMALNSMVPRDTPGFFRGGVAGGVTGTDPGMSSGILNLVNDLHSKYGGYVSSGSRPGDDGFHGRGLAADYVPDDWAGASRAVNSIGSQLLEGIYNPGMFGGTAVSWDSGSRVQPSFWAEQWANHLDHIHLAVGGEVGRLAGQMATKIRNVMISGPEGVLLSMGQQVVDISTAAANQYLAKNMPTSSFDAPAGFYKGPLDRVFPAHDLSNAAGHAQLTPRQVTGLQRKAGLPAIFKDVAWRESHNYPGILGHDPGGTTGIGLHQITTGFNDDVINRFGGQAQMRNPWLNSQAAKVILNRQPTAWGSSGFDSISSAVVSAAMRGGLLPGFSGGGILGAIHPALLGIGSSKPVQGSQYVNPAIGLGDGGTGGFGAIIDVKKFARNLLQADGPGDRRKLMDEARKQIRNRTQLTNLTEEGDLAGLLLKLRETVDLYGENASYAAGITYEDASGKEIAGTVLGPDGRRLGEAGWLQAQLGALFQLRNELLGVEAKTDLGDKAIKKVLEDIRGPKGLLADFAERIKGLKSDLRKLAKERERIQKQIETATKEQEKLRADLEREMGKPKDKRNEALIDSIKNKIQARTALKEKLRGQLGDNRKETGRLTDRLERQTAAREVVRGPLQTVVSERSDALGAGHETLIEELRSVHGSGVTMEQLNPSNPMDLLGILKGEIGDVLLQLRDLGIRDAQADEPFPGLDIEGLKQFSEAVQLGAFSTQPFMGAFQKGGVALVGEGGPELAHLPSGTRVHNASDSVAVLRDAIKEALTIGLRVYIGNRDITEIVRVEMDEGNRGERVAWRAG